MKLGGRGLFSLVLELLHVGTVALPQLAPAKDFQEPVPAPRPFLPDGREPALMGTGLTFLLQPRPCPRALSSPEPLSTRGASTSSLLPSHHLDLLDSVGLLFAVWGIIFFFFKLVWF